MHTLLKYAKMQQRVKYVAMVYAHKPDMPISSSYLLGEKLESSWHLHTSKQVTATAV